MIVYEEMTLVAKRLKKKDAQPKSEVPTTPEPAHALLEKLQVSETRYRRLFETAQDGILLLDAKTGEITDVNPFLLDLLGYPYGEIAGKKLWEIGPFTDRKLAKQAFEKLQKDRYTRYEDLPLQTATGTRIQVEFVSNVYPVGGRDVIQCNIRDITRRKELERGEEMVKNLALAVAELGIWKLDLVTGEAERSLRHDQIFGYPTLLPEWTYEMFLSHVVAEDRSAVAEAFGKALSSKTDWDFTCRIRRQDGEVRWIWAKGKPEFDERHEPVALFGLVQDITKREQEEVERERLLKRQLVLSRITLSLGASTGLKNTLRTLCSEVRSLLDADGFFVSWYQKDTGLITALSIFNEGVECDVGTIRSIPLAEEGKEVQSTVLRTARPLNIPNWIEREHAMQTVYPIESDGSLAPVPPGDERAGCTESALLVPMMFEGEPVGVLQVQSNRLNAYSDEDVDLLAGVANVAAVSIQNALLLEEIQRGLEGTIEALARTTEMKDPYTSGHQQRVSQLACAIAEKMGLGEKTVDGVRVSGLIHDVGKVSIPAEILSKPGRLTPLEFSLVKEHVRIGFDVLKGIVFPWPVAETVLQHHERLDGSGYPCGLRGEAINLGARILAVADVVEAMASHRPYRPALGIDAALAEIRDHQGKLYDPEVVEVCNQLFADGFEFASVGVSPVP